MFPPRPPSLPEQQDASGRHFVRGELGRCAGEGGGVSCNGWIGAPPPGAQGWPVCLRRGAIVSLLGGRLEPLLFGAFGCCQHQPRRGDFNPSVRLSLFLSFVCVCVFSLPPPFSVRECWVEWLHGAAYNTAARVTASKSSSKTHTYTHKPQQCHTIENKM